MKTMTKWIIKKRVLYILDTFEETRNSDTELYIRYFEEFVCRTDEEKQIIKSLFNQAPWLAWLTRRRADIQNRLWLYKATEEVQAMRKIKEEEIQEEFIEVNQETKKEKIVDDFYSTEYWINL